MPRRRVRSVVLTALLAVSVGAAVWALWPSTPGHRLIYTEALPDGRVFQCFSNGSSLGPAGTTVDGGSTGQTPGAGGTGMAMTPPERSEEEMRRAAEEYRKSGRTPEKDAADFNRLSAECERRN